MHTSIKLTALLALLFVDLALADAPARRMAVTVDDLPFTTASVTDDATVHAATTKLLASLQDREIVVTGFVNEAKLYDDDTLVAARKATLEAWLESGMALGNHSFSHPDLHEVSLEEMMDDVRRGEPVTRALLEARGQSLQYFRHPYLHTGRDLATKQAFEAFLAQRGYRVAPVSIDNSEWIFARAYMLALRAGDSRLAERIGKDYVDYMLAMVAFYEDQSDQLFARNISHVLLVHANELNADWFGELADRLSAIGYEFVTLDEALEDPAYESEDTYTGRGGITWLHRWAITQKVDPSMFRGEPTTPDYVLELTRLPEHNY